MRVPFSKPRVDPAGGSLLIPLPDPVGCAYGVYFDAGRELSEEEMEEAILEWLDQHTGPPLRKLIERYLFDPAFSFQVVGRGEIAGPTAEQIKSLPDQAIEAQRFREATRIALVETENRLADARTGFWTTLATARALAQTLEGVILDPLQLRLLSLESYGTDLPAHGRVSIRSHVSFARTTNLAGVEGAATLGMAVFGLPDLLAPGVPAGMEELAAALLGSVGQYVAAALWTRLERSPGGLKELEMDPEAQVELSDSSDHGRSSGTASRVRLSYGPEPALGDQSWIRLEPPAGFQGDAGAWFGSLRTDLAIDPR